MPEVLEGAVLFARAILLPTLSGVLTLGLIAGNRRLHTGLALALGYALGMGILGQVMLLMGWLDRPVYEDTVSRWLLVYIAAVALLFFLRQYFFLGQSAVFSRDAQEVLTWKRRLFLGAMLAYVFYQICFVFWSAFFVPVDQADAFSVYAYKAKVFFYEHSIKRVGRLWPGAYPLQVPLSMTWVALNIGRWQEGWLQMLFPLNCLALLTIVYHSVRSWSDQLTAALACALTVSSLFFVLHASIAYCDFTVMFYTTVSLLLMGAALQQGCLRFIVLSGLMAAFGAAVKLEGLCYEGWGIFILCRFLFVDKSFDLNFRSKALAGFVFPVVLGQIIFAVFKRHYGIQEWWNGGHYFSFSLQQWSWRIPGMIKALADNLFLSGNWNILWVFLTALMLANRNSPKPFVVRFFTFALLTFFLNYFMAVIFTEKAVYLASTDILDSLSRFLLHFFLLCPVLTVLLLHHFLKEERESVVSP